MSACQGGYLPRGCTPPHCGQTDTYENITFPQLLLPTITTLNMSWGPGSCTAGRGGSGLDPVQESLPFGQTDTTENITFATPLVGDNKLIIDVSRMISSQVTAMFTPTHLIR